MNIENLFCTLDQSKKIILADRIMRVLERHMNNLDTEVPGITQPIMELSMWIQDIGDEIITPYIYPTTFC